MAEKVDAAKTRFAAPSALKLLDGVDRLIAIRGHTVAAFDLTEHRPDDATLLAHLMGPTGNLRAPAARVGKLLIVGFNEETYRELLGA